MMHAAKDQETLTEGSKVLTKSCEEFQASACDLLRLVSSDERLLKTICSLTDGSDFDLATFARTFDGKKSCVVKTILFMLKTYMKSARVVCSALHFLSRFLKLKTWETCSSDEKKGLKPPNLILKCHGQSIVINAMREDILQKKETSPEHMSLRVCVGDRILLKDGKEWSVIEVDESIIMVQRSGKLYQRLPLGSTSIERILSSKLQVHGQEVLQSLGQKCLAEVLKAENEQGSRNSSPASSIKDTGTNESQLSISLGSYSSPQGKVNLSFSQRD